MLKSPCARPDDCVKGRLLAPNMEGVRLECPMPRQGMIENKHDNRTNDWNQKAPAIRAGYTHATTPRPVAARADTAAADATAAVDAAFADARTIDQHL
jgi:hypothetical protein